MKSDGKSNFVQGNPSVLDIGPQILTAGERNYPKDSFSKKN